MTDLDRINHAEEITLEIMTIYVDKGIRRTMVENSEKYNSTNTNSDVRKKNHQTNL